jgi:hypothetical protein
MVTKSFSITAAKQAIKLDSKRLGEASFTVTNTSDKPVTGQLKLRPVGAPSVSAAQPQWFGLLGDAKFTPQGTTQVTAKFTVPANVPPGKYGFRLDAISAANPDDDLTEGPLVVVEVTAAEPVQKKPFPWWIVAAAAVVLLLAIGAGTWWALTRGVAVPDVVKDALPLDQASQKIKDANLVPDPQERKVNGLAPNKDKTVVETDPAAGKQLPKGSKVTLYYAVAAPAPQPPKPDALAGGVYNIRNKSSGRVIDVTGWGKTAGVRIQQWNLHGGANQQWLLTPFTGGYFLVMSADSGKAWDILGIDLNNGAQLQQWDITRGANQQFRFDDAGNGFYKITARHSGKVLQPLSGGTGDGVPIVQQPWTGDDAQLWKLVPVETGQVNRLKVLRPEIFMRMK